MGCPEEYMLTNLPARADNLEDTGGSADVLAVRTLGGGVHGTGSSCSTAEALGREPSVASVNAGLKLVQLDARWRPGGAGTLSVEEEAMAGDRVEETQTDARADINHDSAPARHSHH